ncbi:hypothetical protein MF672_039035 [Actinomadura sp. ATCC 31491]|uniref:Uncharacterized protein n=1 Tax=Actinomadura luzonensis TaxID=2805427 RepID=A0ABT0G6B8_9ACTN|nr:hypothetical protein [Actinomadura luzonensis]MCK2219750.1 hypothetical protein [Actinomadura luzonensis]
MNVFDPQAQADLVPLAESDDLLVKLRRWTVTADATADELAKRGGQERETAARHMEAAARYDEQAVAARARADELREVIAIVEERRWKAAGGESDGGPLAGVS